MAPRAGRAARDVVFGYSWETLRDAEVRGYMRPPDRLALHLLAAADRERVLVVEPVRSWPVQRLRHRADLPRPVLPGALRGRSTLSPSRLLPGEPRSPRTAERVYRRVDRQLERALREGGLHDPLLITCHPLLAAFAPARWAASTVYLARDDWVAHPSYLRVRGVVEAAYARMRERGTAVAAVSAPLLERLAPTGPGTVLHNGVDAALWEGPRPPAPAWLRELERPWLLYAGSLDDRLDVAALTRLARGLDRGTVVLLGPVTDERAVTPLRDVPRVVLPGGRSHVEVAVAVRHADACLLLHRSTELTRAMDPLKLYEYLAGGRPVVATDLPALAPLAEAVLTVQPGHDPSAVVREALRTPPCSERERQRFLEQNSWACRHAQLLQFAEGTVQSVQARTAPEAA